MNKYSQISYQKKLKNQAVCRAILLFPAFTRTAIFTKNPRIAIPLSSPAINLRFDDKIKGVRILISKDN